MLITALRMDLDLSRTERFRHEIRALINLGVEECGVVAGRA